MIYYLVTRKHAYTMGEYVESWGKSIAANVRVVPYGALPANRDLPLGTYVFSDLERLGAPQRPIVTSFADQLVKAGARVLNHPARSLRRGALLQRLHDEGVNRFRAHPATDFGPSVRYPVFVREENQHTGALSRLLDTPAEVRQVLLLLTLEGYDPQNLLVVEFCETAASDGVYRKYSAFRVGDRIFPRHVLFSKSWMLKDLDLLEPSHIEEIRAYCRTNPHHDELLRLFDLCGIQYGRIDYALLNGATQVWEINTNPIVARPPADYEPARLAFHEAFSHVFNAAFAALDDGEKPNGRVRIDWSAPA